MKVNLMKLTNEECNELLTDLLPFMLNDSAISIVVDWAKENGLAEELRAHLEDSP